MERLYQCRSRIEPLQILFMRYLFQSTFEIKTQIYVEKAKIKKQFKYANSLEIPYVIVLGEDEIKNGTVSLKNMETGEQQELTIEKLIQIAPSLLE